MTRSLPIVLAVLGAACGDSAAAQGGGGEGGAGGAAPQLELLALPAGVEAGDELVVTVRASSVAGQWDDAASPGAVLTLQAGDNLARDVILVGGFAQETRASLGAWDGGEVRWSLSGEATFETLELSVDASAAGLPILALYSDDFANDTPLLVFRSGDELQYVMTNEDGGTGLLPTLLLAQWGRPHDIEGLFDLVDLTYQGADHATLPFAGALEGTHPRLRMATTNGLVAEEPADSTARYHVSPVPVAFSAGPGVPREAVLDDLPWLVAAGWLEVEREGKVVPAGGVDDGMLGAPSAYVFVDYGLEGGVRVAFEVSVGGTWYSSLGIYQGSTGALDARCSGTGRTAIELPEGETLASVEAVRVVPLEGAGTLAAARVLAYDGETFALELGGELAAPLALDVALGPAPLDL